MTHIEMEIEAIHEQLTLIDYQRILIPAIIKKTEI